MAFERTSGAGWALHPGEILKHEFLKPMDLSGYAVAKAIGVTPQRVSDIVLKKTGISADMALRFSKYFGTSPEFWMNLQAAFELATVRKSLRKAVDKITPRSSAA